MIREYSSYARWIPLALALALVIGNLSQGLPLWGFNYHVLKLPYGLPIEFISNIVILSIGSFPLIRPAQANWLTRLYIVTALFALAVIAVNISVLLQFPWVILEDHERVGGMFATTPSQLLTCIALASYLVWSLSLCFLLKEQIAVIALAVFLTAAVAGARIRKAADHAASQQRTSSMLNDLGRNLVPDFS